MKLDSKLELDKKVDSEMEPIGANNSPWSASRSSIVRSLSSPSRLARRKARVKPPRW